MNKIIRSLAIIRQSLITMGQHPRLLAFPLINLAGLFAILVFFFMPLAIDVNVFTLDEDLPALQERMAQSHDERVAAAEARRGTGLDGFRETFNDEPAVQIPFLVMAGCYLMTMFLVTFFNVAFYSEIMQAFNGNAVSIGRGLAFAMTKLRAIVMWSLLAGIVGIIIRNIEEKVGFVGRWIMGLIGFSWSVASVFAIPVIIRDKQQSNPVAYLKTSAAIIKRTWGEGLAGIVGISAFFIMLIIAIVIAAFMVMLAVPNIEVYVTLLLFVIIFVLGFLSMMMRDIFLCGLYVYATEGVVPAAYDPELMEHAWRVKQKK